MKYDSMRTNSSRRAITKFRVNNTQFSLSHTHAVVGLFVVYLTTLSSDLVYLPSNEGMMNDEL